MCFWILSIWYWIPPHILFQCMKHCCNQLNDYKDTDIVGQGFANTAIINERAVKYLIDTKSSHPNEIVKWNVLLTVRIYRSLIFNMEMFGYKSVYLTIYGYKIHNFYSLFSNIQLLKKYTFLKAESRNKIYGMTFITGLNEIRSFLLLGVHYF